MGPILVLRATAIPGAQPIAFSHKQHVVVGLECLDRHSSADTGAAATIPSVRKCMLCHDKVAIGKPEVKKVIAYANSRREIPWERVYGFPPEALVRFQHAPHVRIPTLTLFSGNKGFEGILQDVKSYSDAGGQILFGTDVGYLTEYADLTKEFALLFSRVQLTLRLGHIIYRA